MKLYGYWRSSSAWRVRIGLALKGVQAVAAPVHLKEGEQSEAKHRSRNPLAQVPVLERDDGKVLSQSTAILHWLDATYPAPPFLPEDLWLRAQALQWGEMINSGIQPLQNLATLKALRALGDAGAREGDGKGGIDRVDAPAWARHFIEEGLWALEQSLACSEMRCAPFATGERPGWVEMFLIPQLYNARRFDVPLAQCSRLLAIEAACETLPEFISAHPDRQVDAPQNG